MKYRSFERHFVGLQISLYFMGIFLCASCQSEDSVMIGTPVDVPINITLGGVRGYASGLDDNPVADTRATTPMATGTRFRVVALQRNRIAGQADYTVTAAGVSADGVTMQLLPGKYKFVAYSFNTTTSLPALNDEGTVPVTQLIDLLFAQDVEEFREVGTDPVSLSFTFVPQRACVRIEMDASATGSSITSPGTVKLTGSFYTGASFSLAGGMLFGYTGAASSYTVTFSDVAGVTRTSNAVYVLPTSGTSTVSIAGATVSGCLPYSGSGTLPALLPNREYVYIQTWGLTEITGLSGANCFVVEKAGRYAINATIKGNGKQVRSTATTGVAADVPATASEVNIDITEGAYAELLWETYNTTTAPTADKPVVKGVSYNAFTKQIIFSTMAYEGNAVIALKDASGNILWSWHIWRTNTTPATQPLAAITGFAAAGELVIMDRNLGALSATAQSDLSTGLHYQWGRKDPMPASAGLVSSNNVAMATQPGGVPIVPSSSAQYTVAQSIQQPTTFFKHDDDWCSSRNDNLWGTPLTAISGRYTTNKGNKTIYDPCPPGWRVPPSYAFANTSAALGGTFNIGYSFSILTSGSSWFPASGRRDGNGSLSNVGEDGGYWTAAPYAALPANASYLYFRNGYVHPDVSNDHRSVGHGCRCAKE